MLTAIECRKVGVSGVGAVQKWSEVIPVLSEMFWFLLSLVLFMVLGPFAAPIALIAVFTIDSEHRGYSEPEAVEEGI